MRHTTSVQVALTAAVLVASAVRIATGDAAPEHAPASAAQRPAVAPATISPAPSTGAPQPSRKHESVTRLSRFDVRNVASGECVGAAEEFRVDAPQIIEYVHHHATISKTEARTDRAAMHDFAAALRRSSAHLASYRAPRAMSHAYPRFAVDLRLVAGMYEQTFRALQGFAGAGSVKPDVLIRAYNHGVAAIRDATAFATVHHISQCQQLLTELSPEPPPSVA